MYVTYIATNETGIPMTYTVTLPNGRTYTYGARGGNRAYALAAKTGGTVRESYATRRADYSDDAYDAARDRACEDGTRRRW